jgi:tRNA(Arg) A34 adenosine deaminase TadA
MPIGAVVVNAEGIIQTRGRNHINDQPTIPGQVGGNQLAHAELNALLALRDKPRDMHAYAIYTAVEPCPLCLGAIYMSGVRTIHYACRDDYAGATDLLGTTPYLSHKPVKVFGPQAGMLEDAILSLQIEFQLRYYSPTSHVIELQSQNVPRGAALGRQLFTQGSPAQWQSAGWDAPAVFNHLFSLLES